tara:strand:+ start:174 stop:968 length:795 start_codon:yes stop_codon:yes gene_type:complete
MGASLSIYGANDNTYRKYGWIVDTPDQRDSHYELQQVDCKKVIDLRDKCPGIYNQGKLGSCTANAIAAAYEFNEIKQDENTIFTPSRLFIYYNERFIENTTQYDSGANIRDGIKSINKQGVCSERTWPYIIENFTTKPNDNCYKEAAFHKSVNYKRVKQNLEHMKNCLNSGLPFVFGFGVYESFESEIVSKTGIMSIPEKNEKLLGGHAVMAVGYNDEKEYFIVRNSWGLEWGDRGYFYMPYKFIINEKMCSDFWCIKNVEDIN